MDNNMVIFSIAHTNIELRIYSTQHENLFKDSVFFYIYILSKSESIVFDRNEI